MAAPANAPPAAPPPGAPPAAPPPAYSINDALKAQYPGGTTAQDGTYTFVAKDGSTNVLHPDGSKSVTLNGVTTTADATGHPTSTVDASTGQQLTPDQIHQASLNNNAPLGGGGLLGLGGTLDTTVQAIPGLARQVTGAVLPNIPGLGGNVDTSSIADAAAYSKGLSQQYNDAYKNFVPQAAPVAAAAQLPPVVLAQIGNAIQAGTATAGEIAAYQAATAPGAISGASASGAGAAAGQSVAAVADPSVRADLAKYDTSLEGQTRDQQQGLIAGLNGAIAGTDPSVAAILLRQATDRNIQNQYALAASAPGMNAGLAARQAMMGASDLNSQAAASQALLRAQEIATMRGQLGEVLNTTRAGDIGVANTTFGAEQGVNNDYAGAQNTRSNLNAQLANTTGIANAGNTTQANVASANNATSASIASANNATNAAQTNAQLAAQTAIANANNQAKLASDQAQLQTQASLANANNQTNASQTTAQLANAIALANANNANDLSKTQGQYTTQTNIANANNQINQQQANTTQQNDLAQNALTGAGQNITGTVGAASAQAQKSAADAQIVGALGNAFTKSDRRSKTDIVPGDDQADELVRALRAYSYRYKDPGSPGAAEGEQLGPMAQDIEKSAAGKRLVVDTAHGKMVDTNRAIMAALAGLGSVGRRLDKVERKAA